VAPPRTPLKPQPYKGFRWAPGSVRGIVAAFAAATLMMVVVMGYVVCDRVSGMNGTVIIPVPLDPAAPLLGASPPAVVTMPADAPVPPAYDPTAAGPDNSAVDDADDDEDAGGVKKKGGRGRTAPATRYGFVTVKAMGVKAAKIYVNGKEAGYSPIVYKVKAGKNTIKLVEEVDGRPGRSKTFDVTVAPTNTRNDPLKLVVPL
jgi:hypothetical protein